MWRMSSNSPSILLSNSLVQCKLWKCFILVELLLWVVNCSLFCGRILEASIAENKATLKRSHAEVWRDSPNPYDRKRQDSCPVGLKNVGNTCWFSAVIQVRLLPGHVQCFLRLNHLSRQETVDSWVKAAICKAWWNTFSFELCTHLYYF